MTNQIKFVFFDWGGTLGKDGQRHQFLYAPKRNDSQAAIKDHAIPILKFLRKQGIGIGIVSNTRYSKQDMNKALKTLGLDKYFDLMVLSSDKGMTRKPHQKIFKHAISEARKIFPKLKKNEMLFVGDKYDKDVKGAHKFMKTVYITNKRPTSMNKAKKSKLHDYVLEDIHQLKNIL